MPDDDSIIVAGGNPGTEAATVVLLKILFGRYQDFGGRIQPQELRSPLFCQVIGYNEHGFAAQAQTLALHGRSNHFIGFACAYYMRQQRIPAIKRVSNRVSLMLPERDLRVHAGEGNVLSVIFAGTDAVEQLIVLFHQSFTPVRIFPYPVPESVLDCLLLLLRKRSGLLVQDTLFFTFCILNGVIDADIPEIERILQDAKTAGTIRAVGQIVWNVVIGKIGLAANAPFGCEIGILHLNRAPLIERHFKQLMHELLDIFLIHPGGTQPHVDFGCVQILGLSLFQRLHVRLKDG